MTDETKPEQPPEPTEMEQLRDSVGALQTMVNRVREAVGADAPAPVRESYRISELETRVSDAEYERDRARQRAEQAEAAIEGVRTLHRKASHGGTCVYCAHGQRLGYDTTWPCDTIRALGKPAPAATEATELETTARVFAALHRSAEGTVTRVIDLYEQWVAAGPPSLGTSMSRWWDKRLVELHNAIQPPAREQRERPTHSDGTPYRHHEIKAEGWEHCDGCRLWGQGWTAESPHQCTNDRVQPADQTTEK